MPICRYKGWDITDNSSTRLKYHNNRKVLCVGRLTIGQCIAIIARQTRTLHMGSMHEASSWLHWVLMKSLLGHGPLPCSGEFIFHMEGEALDMPPIHLWVCFRSGVSAGKAATVNILIGQMFSQMGKSSSHCFCFVNEAVQSNALRHTSRRAVYRSQESLPNPYLSHHSQALGLSVSYSLGS